MVHETFFVLNTMMPLRARGWAKKDPPSDGMLLQLESFLSLDQHVALAQYLAKILMN